MMKPFKQKSLNKKQDKKESTNIDYRFKQLVKSILAEKSK